MGKKEEVPNRQYTLEFKLEAVRLAQSIGGNQAAKRLGIPDSSLWNWLRLSRLGKLETGREKQLRPDDRLQSSKQRTLACDGNWRAQSSIWRS